MEVTEYANWQREIFGLFGGICGNFNGILRELYDLMHSTISRGTLAVKHRSSH
jgi:hypothetical protein